MLVTADSAKEIQAPLIALACPIWMKVLSFLGRHLKHIHTKATRMAGSFTNIFVQLVAPQFQ